MPKIHKNITLLIITIISLFSIDRYSSVAINNTVIWWVLLIGVLVYFFKAKKYFFNPKNTNSTNVIHYYLLWNIICIVRGFFVADGYWEWKFLIQTSLVLLIPISIYLASNTFWLQTVVRQWFFYVFPGFIFFYFFIISEAIGHYLIPVSFVLLFFPFLNKKWRIICIGVAFIVFLSNLSARSNVIKFLIPMLLSLAYYFKFLLNSTVLKITRLIFLILPAILLYLGLTNTFNVFKISDYLEGEYRVKDDEDGPKGSGDLTSDSRTFLYVEVISSALKYDYVWLGRTPARGNESPSFGPGIDEDLGTNKMERHSNEVSILNVFTWTGIVGVILYFLIFLKATYLALYKSKSRMMKIVGIYVAFRWVYAWVEDFSTFNLSFFFLWVVIAMCLSEDFRAMTDNEFKNWVRGIFDQRYRAAIIKKQLVITKK
ncbi:hypothetical protein [Cellulophaga baltica]|uniref:hypothetical protein n=1 Tax=Cellulophaga baltica TaxID=76594 RepID=UPI00249438D6|nr:hypothetical protein [Cellulophaga baltica]